MGKHEVLAVAATLPPELPEASGLGAGCWGTCEELLLVSAVKRHGTNNWNLISSELKDRAISLKVCPLYFSEEACKHKYDALKGRYASTSSCSISRDEELSNSMPWFEELRKLRVAHLKRELERYDGSIGSLQVKIKRLKAERAHVNKQAGKSVAVAQPNEPLLASSHEDSVPCSPTDHGLPDEGLKSVANKLSTQNSDTAVSDISVSVAPENSKESLDPSRSELLLEGEQWHDANKEFQAASPNATEITVNNVDSKPCNDTKGNASSVDHQELEGQQLACGIITGAIEPVVVSGTGVNCLEAVEPDLVVSSPRENEELCKSPEADPVDSDKGHDVALEPAELLVGGREAGGNVLLTVDEDSFKLKGVKEEIAEAKESDFPAAEVAEVEGSEDGCRSNGKDRSMAAAGNFEFVRDIDLDSHTPILEQPERDNWASGESAPSSTPLPSTSMETEILEKIEDVQAEGIVATSDQVEEMNEGQHHSPVELEENQQDMEVKELDENDSGNGLLDKKMGNELVETQDEGEMVIHVGQSPHRQRDGEGVIRSETFVETVGEVVAEKEQDSAEGSVKQGSLVDLTSDSDDQKHQKGDFFQFEKEQSLEPRPVGGLALTESAIEVTNMGMPSTEAADVLDTTASIDTGSLNESEDLDIVLSVSAFRELENDGLGQNPVVNPDMLEAQELAKSSIIPICAPNSVYFESGRDTLEREIVVVLDEPAADVANPKSRPVSPDNPGAEMTGQLSSSVQSDVVSEVEVATAKTTLVSSDKPQADLIGTEIVSVSPDCLSIDWPSAKSLAGTESPFHEPGSEEQELAHPSSANAMDLLRMVYDSVSDTIPESSTLSIDVAAKPLVSEPPAASSPSPSSALEAFIPAGPVVDIPSQGDTSHQVTEGLDHSNTQQLSLHVEMEADVSERPQEVDVNGGNGDDRQDRRLCLKQEGADAENLPEQGNVNVGEMSSVPRVSADERQLVSRELISSPPREGTEQDAEVCKDVMDVDVGKEISSLEGSGLPNGCLPLPCIGSGSGGADGQGPEGSGRAETEEIIVKPELVEEVKPQVVEEEHPEVSRLNPQATQATDVKSEMETEVTEMDNFKEEKENRQRSSSPAMEVAREPTSPVESLVGVMESKGRLSSHEGSGSVHEQSKDGGDDDGEEGRQGTRDYGDSQVDKSEAGSPMDGIDDMSPSSRRNRREPKVPGKLLPLLECLRNICAHKSACLFRGRQEIQDSRYDLLIRRHMDLTIIRARLEEGAYSGSKEFFRDLLLIFNNALVYYPSESAEFLGAKALRQEATKEMDKIFKTEALLKQDGPATRTRELKKPKAVGMGGGFTKVGVTPSPGVGAMKIGASSPVTQGLPESGSKKRVGARLSAVETSGSEAVMDSEGGGARSGSVNVVGVPSTSRVEERGDSLEDDQEVDGRMKEIKKLHKGGVLGRAKPPREELLGGLLLNKASNKASGRGKLRETREDDLKRPAVPNKGVGRGKVREKVRDEREKQGEKDRGKERDEIEDDDLLRKGKSLSKVRDRDVVGDGKSALNLKASIAARVSSTSQDTLAQSLIRPARGLRKTLSSMKEPSRVPEQQAKKRLRK